MFFDGLRSGSTAVRTSYHFDFLRYCGVDYKNVDSVFPENIWVIIIDGKRLHYDPYDFEEVGWSSDHKYRKVYTQDVAFWVSPDDYKDFIRLLKDLKQKCAAQKVERDKSMADLTKAYLEPCEYDDIDDDIYRCFISDKGGFADLAAGDRFERALLKWADICAQNGGKLFKSSAKGAKFAIIQNYTARLPERIKELHADGYKVTNFERIVTQFGLGEYWDVEAVERNFERFRSELAKRHGKI